MSLNAEQVDSEHAFLELTKDSPSNSPEEQFISLKQLLSVRYLIEYQYSQERQLLRTWGTGIAGGSFVADLSAIAVVTAL